MFVSYFLISSVTSSWASFAGKFTSETKNPEVFLGTDEHNVVANGAGDVHAISMSERHEMLKTKNVEAQLNHHNTQKSNADAFLVVGFASGHDDFSNTCASFAKNLSNVMSARVALNLKLCVLKVNQNFAEISKIQETTGVELVEHSVKFHPMELQGQHPTDLMWNVQIGFRDMDFPNAWSVHAGSVNKKQKVAVIDSGLDKEHPDFWHDVSGSKVSIFSMDSKNFIDDTDPNDETGHGMGVAGIIAADTTLKKWTYADGVPPGFATGTMWSGVEILALKFIDQNSVGESAHLVLALDFLLSHADVRLSTHAYGAYYDSASHTHIARAFSALSKNDHLAIAAAGNDGRLLTGNDLMYPCCFGIENGGPLCVANFNVTRVALNAHSNRGSRCVHVAAAGFALAPTKTFDDAFTQYSVRDSTSTAAAYTTGVAALVTSLYLDRGESITADQIRTKLQETVKPHDLEVSTGGVINAYKAVFRSLGQCPSTQCPSPNLPWMCSDNSCKENAYACRQLGLYVRGFCPPAGSRTCLSWTSQPGNCPSGFTPDTLKAHLECDADSPCTKEKCCKGCGPHQGALDQMLCFDGTACTTTFDSICCEYRARCPYNMPYMCKKLSWYSVPKEYGGISRSGDDARCQISPYECEPDGLVDRCPTLCASLGDGDKTGYKITEHSTDIFDFSIDVSCDTSKGYTQIVGSAPQARPCTQPHGKYSLSGCELVPECTYGTTELTKDCKCGNVERCSKGFKCTAPGTCELPECTYGSHGPYGTAEVTKDCKCGNVERCAVGSKCIAPNTCVLPECTYGTAELTKDCKCGDVEKCAKGSKCTAADTCELPECTYGAAELTKDCKCGNVEKCAKGSKCTAADTCELPECTYGTAELTKDCKCGNVEKCAKGSKCTAADSCELPECAYGTAELTKECKCGNVEKCTIGSKCTAADTCVLSECTYGQAELIKDCKCGNVEKCAEGSTCTAADTCILAKCSYGHAVLTKDCKCGAATCAEGSKCTAADSCELPECTYSTSKLTKECKCGAEKCAVGSKCTAADDCELPECTYGTSKLTKDCKCGNVEKCAEGSKCTAADACILPECTFGAAELTKACKCGNVEECAIGFKCTAADTCVLQECTYGQAALTKVCKCGVEKCDEGSKCTAANTCELPECTYGTTKLTKDCICGNVAKCAIGSKCTAPDTCLLPECTYGTTKLTKDCKCGGVEKCAKGFKCTAADMCELSECTYGTAKLTKDCKCGNVQECAKGFKCTAADVCELPECTYGTTELTKECKCGNVARCAIGFMCTAADFCVSTKTTTTLTTTSDSSEKPSCCPTEVTCSLHDCGRYSGSTLKPNSKNIKCPNDTCTNALCCDGLKIGTGNCVLANGASAPMWKQRREWSPQACANFCQDYPLSCVGFSWEPSANSGWCTLYKDHPLAVPVSDSNNHTDTNMVNSCFVRKVSFAAEWPIVVNPLDSEVFFRGCLVKGNPKDLRTLFPSNGIKSTRACAVHCASFDLFALHETDCLCMYWEELNDKLKLLGEFGHDNSCGSICHDEGNLIPTRYCGTKSTPVQHSAVALYEVLAIENGADCPDNGHKVNSEYVYLRGAVIASVNTVSQLLVRSCEQCAKACTDSNLGTNHCNGYVCVPSISNVGNMNNFNCTLVGNPIPSAVGTGARHVCARRPGDDVEVVTCADKYDRQSGFVMLHPEAGLRETFTNADNCDNCATSCTNKHWCVAYQCSTLLRTCALFNNENLLNRDNRWMSTVDLIDISLCLKLPTKKCIVQDGTMLHEQNCLCGNDGSTMCRGQSESCSVRKPDLFAGQSGCGNSAPSVVVGTCLRVRECEKCGDLGCPNVIAHVCATNGRTYGNRCYATCAGQQVAHVGSCDDKSPRIFSTHCNETTVDTDVICGSDKNTYLNRCFLNAVPGIHAVTSPGEICPVECTSTDVGQRALCSSSSSCACWRPNGTYTLCPMNTHCTATGTCAAVCSSICDHECLCETGPNVRAYCGQHERCVKNEDKAYSSCIPDCGEYPHKTVSGNSQCVCGSLTKCSGSNINDSEATVCQQSRCVRQRKGEGQLGHLTCLPDCDAFSGSGDGSWKTDCVCETKNHTLCLNHTYCNATAETCVPGCANINGLQENKDSCICGTDLKCGENNYCYKKQTASVCLYEPITECTFRNGQAPNVKHCLCGTSTCDENEFCTMDARHGNECTAGPISVCPHSTSCVSKLCKCDKALCPPGSICSPGSRGQRECTYVLPRCSKKWERKCLCGSRETQTVCDVAPDGSHDWACTKPGIFGSCAKPPQHKCPEGYHLGTSYDFVMTTTLQACAHACSAEPLCSHFVYKNHDKCERFYEFGVSNPDGYYDEHNVAVEPRMLCEKNCAMLDHDCASPMHPVCDAYDQKCRKCTPVDCGPGQYCTMEGRCANEAEVTSLCNNMPDARKRSLLPVTQLDNLGKRVCLQEFSLDYCDLFFWNMQRVGKNEAGGSCEFWCNKDGLSCAKAWRDSQHFVFNPFAIGCPKGPESSCDALPTNSICRCSRVPLGGDCGGSPNLMCASGGGICFLKNGTRECTTADARTDCACRGPGTNMTSSVSSSTAQATTAGTNMTSSVSSSTAQATTAGTNMTSSVPSSTAQATTAGTNMTSSVSSSTAQATTAGTNMTSSMSSSTAQATTAGTNVTSSVSSSTAQATTAGTNMTSSVPSSTAQATTAATNSTSSASSLKAVAAPAVTNARPNVTSFTTRATPTAISAHRISPAERQQQRQDQKTFLNYFSASHPEGPEGPKISRREKK